MSFTAHRSHDPRQIDLKNVVLGILIKEKARLLLLLLYLFAISALVYWLSANLLERATAGTYANPNVVLYFRLAVMSSPLLIGLLFGVPLLSTEYESGSFRFLFTQGVGRRRWLKITLAVYFISILLLSIVSSVSTSHFLNIQRSAQFYTIWSFGVFVSQPVVIVPLTLATFIAGVLIGGLTKRVLPGIALALTYVAFFALGLKALFDALVTGFVQRLYDSAKSLPHQHYDFYGQNDPKYLFQIQMLFLSFSIILTCIFTFASVRALDNRISFRKRLWRKAT